MTYELRQYDTPLLRFEVLRNTDDPELRILWVNSAEKHLLPLELEPNEDSLSSWIRHRVIPRNRAYVNRLLAKCGLSVNRPMDIISVCKGLSLNDSYWVVEEGFAGKFDKYNLYDNHISRILGLISFTGYGSNPPSSLASSPEFTTGGMLPKCWRRVDGKIKLFKGGTSGASNTGNEPYSEYYAFQIADKMGIRAVRYGLSCWKGYLCSTCELFTDKDHAFVPTGQLLKKGGLEDVYAYYQSLGSDYAQAFRDMLVFDAVVCNTDRHYGNFGFLVDSSTNRICAPAPLFDHGNSLFSLAGEEYMASEESLQRYADTLLPRVYDDFIGTAKQYMNAKNREQLRRLVNFRFHKHTLYNYPDEYLRRIERMVQKRVNLLLE